MEKGYTLYLTGLSGAGKSTLAERAVNYLKEKNKNVQLLDGDILRSSIGNMFGYSRQERTKMSRVVKLLCKLLNQNGVIAVVASICPYEDTRMENRSEIENYYEVYVNCPVEVCIERDVKGLYRKALNGYEKDVIGIDLPYEIPANSSLVVNTHKESVEESFEKIKGFIDNLDIEK